MPTTTNRHDISRTVSASKNLRAISTSLVEKLRTSDGISSTAIANQLASDAVRDLVSSLNVSEQHLVAVEKNIRRRLYDSLKVLVSIGAIRRRNDKTLHWQGVSHLFPPNASSPHPSISQQLPKMNKTLDEARLRLSSKSASLQHLHDQIRALEHLNHRNRTRQTPITSPRLQLPFVLVRTPSTSDIKLETTRDAHSLTFHFSEPFEVINDYNILDRLFFVAEAKNQNEGTSTSPESPRSPRPQVTPQKHIVLASHTVHATPSDRRPDELPSPASLIGSAKRRQRSRAERLAETPLQSPKRRRISGASQFMKFTSGDKPPLSPATALLHGPRGKKPLRRVMIRSPLQASLRALAGSPRGCEHAGFSNMLSRSPESQGSRGDVSVGTPESALRGSMVHLSPGKNADEFAESFLKSPEVRSSGPLKKRIYGPGRNFLTGADSSGTNGEDELAMTAGELLEKADIMLTPGMSPLDKFMPRTSPNSSRTPPVVRRLFGHD